MRIDLYQRAETAGNISYLAVPAGALIPDEVVSTDWRDVEQGLELDEARARNDYAINAAEQQIAEKGYAITSFESFLHGLGA